MKPMPFPDRHHVIAADGWLDLGVPAEALGELARLSGKARSSRVASHLAWRAHAELRQWTEALVVAEHLVCVAPDEVAGWLHRSYALHELHRTREASGALLPAVERFPQDPIIRYNLACYACRMDDFENARRWLREVARLKDIQFLKELAMSDPDLADMRDEIAGWAQGIP